MNHVDLKTDLEYTMMFYRYVPVVGTAKYKPRSSFFEPLICAVCGDGMMSSIPADVSAKCNEYEDVAGLFVG